MQKKIIQRNVKDKKFEAVKDQLTKKKADQSRFTGKKSVVQELVKDEPVKKGPETGSGYLIAGDGRIEDLKKEVLYQLLGPVFFGDTVFHSEKELIHFFKEQYGRKERIHLELSDELPNIKSINARLGKRTRFPILMTGKPKLSGAFIAV